MTGAAKVATNTRRGWRNPRILIQVALPKREVDALGSTPGWRLTSTNRTAECGPACPFVDEELVHDDEIVFNAGTHVEAIRIDLADFLELVRPRTGRFAEPQLAGVR